ncbi:GMC family oxidoreductase [Bacillus cereus]|uniref:GMC family oxidoreductase n=1 Tax=Bacillus cereus TaxID=1396 RepID=UPI00396F55CC
MYIYIANPAVLITKSTPAIAGPITNAPEFIKLRSLAAFVRASYSTFTHFGGQCKMGKNIGDGVVDAFLNVFGTKNLKVADLSIAPILPDGNTSTAAQMIGLNAVRFIREDTSPYVVDDEDFERDDGDNE